MKIKPGLIFAVALMIIGIYAFVNALSWRWFEAKFLPAIISGLVALLGINQVRIELSSRGKAKESEVDEEEAVALQKRTGPQWRRFGMVMSWIAGAVVASYLVGFTAAAFLFGFVYIKTHGRTWLRSLAYSAILTAVLYAIFVIGLKIPIYKGIFFS